MLSYAHGASSQPLLGETIGHNLERTIARVPDAEALVSCHQGLRYTYAEFGDAVDRLAGGMLAAGLHPGDRVGVWGPNRAEWTLVQYATARIGVILVNVNPAYRLSELQYALAQSGCRWIISTQALKGSDFVAMVDQVRPDLPGLERAMFWETAEWEELASGEGFTGDLRAIGDELDFDDPINIQYTSGTTGFPKGATLYSPQHPEQRLLHRRAARLRRARPRLHPGSALPLLRHGARQPGRDHARQLHRVSGRDVRSGGHAAGMLGGALHERVRRADDVHRRARPRSVHGVRLRLAADGDHGGVAVPDRGHEAGQRRDGNRGDEHLLSE